jgi:hypothetical protein
MRKTTLTVVLLALLALPANLSWAQATPAVKVTADNYVRAETDYQLKTYVEDLGCFGKFIHSRKPYDVDNQVTIRANRDTLYSFGVFDLTSPVTITLPDPKGRYQSLMVISQDHSIAAAYSPKKITLTKDMIGTRYVFLAIRTFMDPNDEADVKAAHKLQDQVLVKQADVGKYEVPNWDKEGLETLRAAINVLGATMPDWSTFFGVKEQAGSNPSHDGNRGGLGRPSQRSRDLQRCLSHKERWDDCSYSDVERRAGRCLLVSDALRRRGVDADQRIQCLRVQQTES